jgi:hypothetical protein
MSAMTGLAVLFKFMIIMLMIMKMTMTMMMIKIYDISGVHSNISRVGKGRK